LDKEMMDEFIERTVALHSKLDHNRNTGGAHRIHNGSYKGSLWIHSRPRLGVFTLETTGDVPSILNNELTRRFGKNLSENSRRYKLWQVENRNDVEAIIAYWGQM
jgi:hypothetical protein